MIRLAAPLVLAEIGWMSMGVVDTMVVGRVSDNPKRAEALKRARFFRVIEAEQTGVTTIKRSPDILYVWSG